MPRSANSAKSISIQVCSLALDGLRPGSLCGPDVISVWSGNVPGKSAAIDGAFRQLSVAGRIINCSEMAQTHANMTHEATRSQNRIEQQNAN